MRKDSSFPWRLDPGLIIVTPDTINYSQESIIKEPTSNSTKYLRKVRKIAKNLKKQSF